MWQHALKILIKKKRIKQKQTWDSKDTFVSLLKHKSAIFLLFPLYILFQCSSLILHCYFKKISDHNFIFYAREDFSNVL